MMSDVDDPESLTPDDADDARLVLGRFWLGMVAGPNPQSEDDLLKLVGWLQLHADALPDATLLEIRDGYMPEASEEGNALRDNMRRYAWTAHHALYAPASDGQGGSFYRPRDEPEPWLLAAYGLGPKPARKKADAVIPAFTYTGVEGHGRITSDQVTFAVLAACIAPKEAWGVSTTGWPIHRSEHGTARIGIMLRPEMGSRTHKDAQRDEMNMLRDALNVSHYDTVAALIEQVMADGSPDRMAYFSADAMLTYRGIKKKTGKDGLTHGHHVNLQNAVADAVYVAAHLHITVEGLPIREDDGKGGTRQTTINLNEKLLTIQGDITRPEDDEPLAWKYRLGQWFDTFTDPINRMVGYQTRKALSYHPIKEQWTKQLAHYLALEFRRNANKGRTINRTAGVLLDGAGITVDPRYPAKAKDRLEDALRRLLRDGLCRLEYKGKILDGASTDLDAWTIAGADLPPRDWIGEYRKRSVTLYAPLDLEQRYDKEIRRLGKGGK
jgi:hypothetical protein